MATPSKRSVEKVDSTLISDKKEAKKTKLAFPTLQSCSVASTFAISGSSGAKNKARFDKERVMKLWRELTEDEKDQFNRKYRNIIDLVEFDVDWNLIRAMFLFWDPDSRCFVLDGCVLTPTIEEYQEMLGFPRGNLGAVFLPKKGFDAKKELGKIFNTEPVEMAEYVKVHRNTYHGVHLNKLLKLRDLKTRAEGHREYRVRALALVIYGLVIFPKASEIIDSAVIYFFARIIVNGVNPVPAILAETIQNMNLSKKGQVSSFSFCAPLLQTWIYSHFLASLENEATSQVQQTSRPIVEAAGGKVDSLSVDQWKETLTNNKQVIWVARWLPKVSFLQSCKPFTCVPLIGPWSCTSYAPSLVARQFYARQNVPKIEGLCMVEESLWEGGNWDLINKCKGSWVGARRCYMQPQEEELSTEEPDPGYVPRKKKDIVLGDEQWQVQEQPVQKLKEESTELKGDISKLGEDKGIVRGDKQWEAQEHLLNKLREENYKLREDRETLVGRNQMLDQSYQMMSQERNRISEYSKYLLRNEFYNQGLSDPGYTAELFHNNIILQQQVETLRKRQELILGDETMQRKLDELMRRHDSNNRDNAELAHRNTKLEQEVETLRRRWQQVNRENENLKQQFEEPCDANSCKNAELVQSNRMLQQKVEAVEQNRQEVIRDNENLLKEVQDLRNICESRSRCNAKLALDFTILQQEVELFLNNKQEMIQENKNLQEKVKELTKLCDSNSSNNAKLVQSNKNLQQEVEALRKNWQEVARDKETLQQEAQELRSLSDSRAKCNAELALKIATLQQDNDVLLKNKQEMIRDHETLQQKVLELRNQCDFNICINAELVESKSVLQHEVEALLQKRQDVMHENQTLQQQVQELKHLCDFRSNHNDELIQKITKLEKEVAILSKNRLEFIQEKDNLQKEVENLRNTTMKAIQDCENLQRQVEELSKVCDSKTSQNADLLLSNTILQQEVMMLKRNKDEVIQRNEILHKQVEELGNRACLLEDSLIGIKHANAELIDGS